MQKDFVTIEELSRGTVLPNLKKAEVVEPVKLVQVTPAVKDVPSIIPSTEAHAVDLKNLVNSQGMVVKFSLSNTGNSPLIIYLGTCIPFDGNWAGLNIPAPGNENPDFSDQLGVTAPKLRVFNKRVNYKNGIVLNEINIFAPDNSPARNISFEKIEIDLNANNCVIAGRIPVSNSETNGVFYRGLFPLSDSLGLRFTMPANTSFELELGVLAESVPNLKKA